MIEGHLRFESVPDHFLVWLWHALFDGTWACRCWRAQWMNDHRAGLIAQRQHACGNCDFCLYPVDVLIARGEITCGTGRASSTTLRSRFRKPWTRRSATRSSAQV